MEDRSIVETLAQALGQFETIGMPARNLAFRTRREYTRDLRDLLTYLEQRGTQRLDEVRPQALEGYLAEFVKYLIFQTVCLVRNSAGDILSTE